MQFKNPYKPGDLCTMTHHNGAGEGILWQVIAVKGAFIRIKPAFAITGPSVLRAKRVEYHAVQGINLVQLCELRHQFDEFIQSIVKQRSTSETVEAETEELDDVVVECTCPDWWFPQERREKLCIVPGIHHHDTCKQGMK